MKDHQEIIIKFSNFLVSKGVSPKSLKFYRSDLLNYLNFSDPNTQYSAGSINSYLKLITSHSSVKTVNRKLSTLRRFSEFLLSQGITSSDFTAEIKNLTGDDDKERFLASSIDSFDRFLINQKVSKSTRSNYLSDINKYLSWNKKSGDGVKKYLSDLYVNANRASYDRTVSSLRKYFEYKKKDFPISKLNIPKKAAYAPFQEKILHKLQSWPRIQALIHNLFYSRPKWYKIYHNYPLSSYLHFALLVIFSAMSGYLIYNRLFAFAYPTSPVTPNRYLSFQGRLTNASGTPITAATNVVFKFYDASSGGSTLWNSGTCSIDPDQDGIFSTLLGSSCGGAIASSVFTENAGVWLGVTVAADSEATPRIQVATVAYALNSETVQGFPLGTGTSTVPYIDSTGKLAIAAASPTIESSSGTFAVTGQAMTISTANTTNGSIAINPDGTGTLNLNFEGTAAGGSVNGFVNAVNANITGGALYGGTVASNASGYNFVDYQSGASPTSKFSVSSTGAITTSSGLTIGTTSLSETTSPTDSGAFLVGANDEFANSASTTVQGVLNDLDAAISAGVGDITAVGSMTTGAVFADATADDDWLGLGVAEGRIEFDDQTVDEINLLAANVGINTAGPDARLDSLATSGEQLRLTYTDGSVYTGFTVDSGGDLTIVPSGGDVSITGNLSVSSTFSATTGIITQNLQVNNASALAYNRFGSATTGHGGNITNGDDLLISGDLELDGNLFLDGGIIANSAGTTSVSLTATPTTGTNVLAGASWLVENTTNVGLAALLVNQTKAGDLFTASVSGSPKVAINPTGDLSLGYNGTAIPVTTNPLMVYGHNTTNVASIDTSGNAIFAGDLTITGGNVTGATTFDSSLTVTGTLTANGIFDANGIVTLGDGGDSVELSGSSMIFDIGGTDEVTLSSTALVPSTTDGNALGSTTNMWSDLFLASGGVINWDNGDVTITHAANDLAFAGVTGDYSFDDAIVPAADGGSALGAAATAWSDLFINTAGTINFENGDVTITHSTDTLDFANGDINITITDGDSINFDGDGSPTADVLTIGNGDVSATAGVDSLAVIHDSLNASGSAIDITLNGPGGNGTDTTTAINVNAFTYTTSAGTNTVEGLTIGTLTESGSVTSHAMSIAGGWDIDIDATTNLELGIGGTSEVTLTSSALAPSTSDSNALGTTSLMWSDLFLASGSVVNFNNGDITLTHSADTLTWDGGSLAFNTDTNVVLTGGVNGLSFDTNVLSIDATNNRVGIGLTAPTTALEVSGDIRLTTSGDQILADTSGVDNKLYVPSATTRWTMESAGSMVFVLDYDNNNTGTTFSIYHDAADTGGTEVFRVTETGVTTIGTFNSAGTAALCWDNAGDSTVNDCSGAPVADYAELYPTDGTVEFGDIVATSNNTTTIKRVETDRSGNASDPIAQQISILKKTDKKNQNTVIGVASANWSDFSSTGHNVIDESSHPLPIALSGRVPVKIRGNSAHINVGDPIISSEEAGKAMRADGAGRIIGTALEEWSPQAPKEKILIYVNNTYYYPELAMSQEGNLTISGNDTNQYQVTTADNNIVQSVGAFASVVTAKLRAGFASFEKTETQILSPVAGTDLIVDLQPDNSQKASSLAVRGEEDKIVAEIDASGNADFEGNVETKDLTVTNNATVSGTLYAENIDSGRLNQIENLLKEVESSQVMLAESVKWNANTATPSGVINNIDELAVKTLFVTEKAALTSLFVSETFTVNTIESIDAPLKIQSLALSPIEIMAGKIQIDVNGNTKFIGNVEVAGDLTVEKLVVANNNPPAQEQPAVETASTQSNAIAGKSKIASGSAEIKIANTNINDKSLIYVTPVSSTQNKVLYVKSKENGNFTVGFNEALDADVDFNWWIIETKQ